MVTKKKHPFVYTFGIPIKSNLTEFKLEQNSRIHDQYLTGIQIERATANKKSINNNPLVNDNAFNSSYITLKQRNTEVVEKLPLTLIEKWTNEGRWFPVSIPNLDMAQSNILCADKTLLVDGEEYQLTFQYIQNIIQKK